MQEVWDKKCYKLVQRFQAVMNDLLMEEEYDELVELQNQLSYPAITEYGEDEYFQFQEISKILNRGRIHVDTLAEYRFVLFLTGMKAKDIDELLAHENAHVNVAESFNAIVHGYVLDISMKWEGNRKAFVLQPAADVDLPYDWSEENRRRVSELMAYAPKLYGECLSEGDIKILEQLRQRGKVVAMPTALPERALACG
ncbi:MAG: hypothetical protein AAGG68_23495 [Bacteroidota bacterium]